MTTSAMPAPDPRPLALPQHLTAERLERLRAWSYKTFGPGTRLGSGMEHVRKELGEIEADPSDVIEWGDAVILLLSTAMRSGHEPQAILDAILTKMDANEQRVWPDWRTFADDQVIEHVRA